MTWSADQILAESAAWHWAPPGSEEVRTDRIQLFVRAGIGTVVSAPPADGSGADALLDEVRDQARRHGVNRLLWRIGPRPWPADLGIALRAAGAREQRREDVCALDLATGVPDLPVPTDVLGRRVRSVADEYAYATVAAEVWDRETPTEQQATEKFGQRDMTQPGGPFVAYLDGRPAGSAGYTLAGEVARLWGGGVLPEFRGRGVYRALVAARLADAVWHGATLGLVHGLVDTSAPILRRLGFAAYGQNTLFTLSTNPRLR